MTSLTDFLIARLAEDEAAANYANTGVRWESWNRSWDTEPQRDIVGGGVRLFTVPTMYDEHIARHDPARVLADVEAKRKIVERFAAEAKRHQTSTDELFFGETLRDLASIYADHPDYREEWLL